MTLAGEVAWTMYGRSGDEPFNDSPGFLTHEARLNATSTAARNVAVQVEGSSGDFGHFWPLHAPCLGARGMDYQRALWFRVHRFPFCIREPISKSF
jgi:hypothetical protein